MKYYTSIPKRLTPFWNTELLSYHNELNKGDLVNAWRHLERAHIIGQRYPVEHTKVHWKMLLFGFKIKSGKEILGQIPRLLVGGVKSFVGKIPVGNPGGSNVPPLKAFDLDVDLQEIFRLAGLDSKGA